MHMSIYSSRLLVDGGLDRIVISMFNCRPTGRRFEAFGMSSHVCATGHIYKKNPVPLVKKSRVLCPVGRFAHSFNHFK